MAELIRPVAPVKNTRIDVPFILREAPQHELIVCSATIECIKIPNKRAL
jgi:hypothetical protein